MTKSHITIRNIPHTPKHGNYIVLGMGHWGGGKTLTHAFSNLNRRAGMDMSAMGRVNLCNIFDVSDDYRVVPREVSATELDQVQEGGNEEVAK